MPSLPDKTCPVCGRSFSWRRKWAKNWDAVKYCSDACRRGTRSPAGAPDLEAAIVALLAQRPRDATICPSEVARAASPDDWRGLMQPVRDAARRLVAAGRVVIVQNGRVVDGSTAKGPIRIRRA